MNFYIFLAVLFLFFVYFGQVLGMRAYCEMSNSLERVKKFVFVIPLLRPFLFMFLVWNLAQEKDWESIAIYIKLPSKSTLIMCALEKALSANELKSPTKKNAHKKDKRNSGVRSNRVVFEQKLLPVKSCFGALLDISKHQPASLNFR